MSPPIDHLRHGIQQLLAAATHRLSGFASDHLQDLVEGGCRLIQQHAVAGAVQIPGQDGDRWSLELRQEAERAHRLLRAGHLRPEARQALQRLVRALAGRQETLFALLDFQAGGRLPAQGAPGAVTTASAHPDGPEGGCWLWWGGKRYNVPKGIVYQLLAHMWTRDSESYDAIDGPVYDGVPAPGTIRGNVSRLNNMVLRKAGVPWRLTTDSTSRIITKQPRDSTSRKQSRR
jgi:hypothetical protein